MTHRLPARSRWFATPALAAITVLATALAGGAPAQAASSHGWRVIRIVQPFNTNLLAIAAFRGSPAWVGGGTPAEAPVAYHLVRGTLHPVALPGPTPSFVNSMSATSPTNVWASLSNAPGGPVVRLTKHGWVAHAFPIGTDQILADGVVTLSPKDTWAFNYDVITKTGYAYHYNGLSWHRQALPASVDANSDTGLVSGSSPSNIWALTFVKNRYASLRYNGKKWQVIPFPGSLAPAGTTVFAREILAVSETDVWAPIFTSTKTGVGPVVLLHWNGARWSKITGKPPRAALVGPLASDGSGGLWLSASNEAFTKPLLLHYSRGKWSTYTVPTAGGKDLSITALALIPGSHSVLGAALIGETPGGNFGTAVLKYGP